jgi:hypothetical protein
MCIPLEQPEDFEDDHDNDNHSNNVKDVSAHAGANIKFGVRWPAFMQIKRSRRTRISCLIYLVYGIERSGTSGIYAVGASIFGGNRCSNSSVTSSAMT